MKIKKVVVSILILITIVSACELSFATTTSSASPTSPVASVLESGVFNGGVNAEGSKSSGKITGAILNIVRIAGAGVALAMLMVVALKYMMASAGDRADLKKYAINYIIGAVILFGASTLLTIIQEFVFDVLN